MTQPRVLVATDFSGEADEALRQGHAYAAGVAGLLAVCHVVPSEILSHPLFPHRQAIEAYRVSIPRESAVEALKKRVHEVTGREPDSFPVFVEQGAADAMIVRAAETWGADRIVVGSVGSTGLARMLLGSVALRVARHAHCPVLVARPGRGRGGILVGTDFSDPALPAISAAAAEARRTASRLMVLHSLELPLTSMDPVQLEFGLPEADLIRLRTEAEALVKERLAEVLARSGVPGESRTTRGKAAAELVRVAEEIDAHLVVVGTAGRTGLTRVLLGSVAEAVVQMAPCSVLVVRLHPTIGG